MLYLQNAASFLWGDQEGSRHDGQLLSGCERKSHSLLHTVLVSSITVVAEGTTVEAIQTAATLSPYLCQYWKY